MASDPEAVIARYLFAAQVCLLRGKGLGDGWPSHELAQKRAEIESLIRHSDIARVNWDEFLARYGF